MRCSLLSDGQGAGGEGEEATELSMIRAALIAAFGFFALYQPGGPDPAPAISILQCAKSTLRLMF